MSQNDRVWIVDPFVQLRLLTPDQHEVQFRTRKAAGLFAVLILCSPSWVRRSDLGTWLWPEADRNRQLQNCRQALAMLRQSLPEDTLMTSRDAIRLSPQFEFKLLETESWADPSTFLAEFSEPWFAAQRSARNSTNRNEKDPILLFDELLTWTVESSPVQTLDLLRASKALADSLPAPRLLEVVLQASERIGTSHSHYGWSLYWKGWAFSQMNQLKSMAMLRSASDFARSQSDRELETESKFLMGFAEIVGGNILRAESIAKAGVAQARAAGDLNALGKMQHLAGSVKVHRGDLRGGIMLLHQAENSPCYQEDPYQFGILLSHQALYLATLGDVEAATSLIDRITRSTNVMNHKRLQNTLTMAKLLCHIALRQPEEVIPTAEALAQHSLVGGHGHWEVYARETLAVAKLQMDQRDDAIREAKRSKRRRGQIGIDYTAWDLERLKDFRRN